MAASANREAAINIILNKSSLNLFYKLILPLMRQGHIHKGAQTS